MLKGSLRRWSFVGLLVVALGVTGGCVSDETASNADFILQELDNSSAPAGAIELEGETLVYSADLPDLVSRVRSVSLASDKKDVVIDYLVLQERINCILDKVEEAAADVTTVQCHGKVLVDKIGEHGLLGISEILEEFNARQSEPAKRDYLVGYLSFWDEVERVNRVEESLGQMKRSNAIPLFGMLLKTIHRFPILYEGDELVPKKDIPKLLDQYRPLDTDEARRALVTEYLGR
ncbi:MAG: hypothetical protein O2783_04475 [Chloroflexi bacterium]|nr:hypothetical protein [Chloroflexota bacterium]